MARKERRLAEIDKKLRALLVSKVNSYTIDELGILLEEVHQLQKERRALEDGKI